MKRVWPDPLATYTDPELFEAVQTLAAALSSWQREGAAEEPCVHEQGAAAAEVFEAVGAVLTACGLVPATPAARLDLGAVAEHLDASLTNQGHAGVSCEDLRALWHEFERHEGRVTDAAILGEGSTEMATGIPHREFQTRIRQQRGLLQAATALVALHDAIGRMALPVPEPTA